MAKSDIIRTQRLRIEPFSGKYLTGRYVGWLNNQEVMRFSEQRHKKHTIEGCREYMNSFDGTPNFFWAISAVDTELGHIGNINAYVDEFNSLADIGIMVGETKAWGKGYATEAWTAVCGQLFIELNIRKITAGTIATNKAMLNLMERVGMVDDGRRIRHYIWEGEEVDVIHRAIFKKDFAGYVK